MKKLPTYQKFTYSLTAEEKKDFDYHTKQSIKSTKYIQSLSDDTIKELVDSVHHWCFVDVKKAKLWVDPKGKLGKLVKILKGKSEYINPNWVSGRVAETAWSKGILEDDDFYRLNGALS